MRAQALALLLAGVGGLSAADDWPQFRGPSEQGLSEAKGLPLTWSETEHIKWKTALPGQGWSSPVVAHGQIWMTTALDEGHSLHALCVDLATGALLHDVEVFRKEIVAPKNPRNSHASPTPTIAGGRVFVNFGSMGTAALDAATGAKLWENRDLVVDFQNGAGASPTVYEDKLIVTCDGMDFQYEVGLEVATGRIAWKTERSAKPHLMTLPVDYRKAYPTPVTARIDGRDESLADAASRLYAYEPLTGREIWFLDIPGISNVATPVWNADYLVVPTGLPKAEIWGVRLGKMEGDCNGDIIWKQKAGAPGQASPVLVGQRVYMVSDAGVASCLDVATGEIVWKERIGSDFAASPLSAEGRIYFFDSKGPCTVIEAGDVFKVLAKNELDSGFMASPAVAGRDLILRTKDRIYCVEDTAAQ